MNACVSQSKRATRKGVCVRRRRVCARRPIGARPRPKRRVRPCAPLHRSSLTLTLHAVKSILDATPFLPPLSTHPSGTETEASTNRKHDRATIRESLQGFVQILQVVGDLARKQNLVRMQSMIWTGYNTTGRVPLQYSTEQSVGEYVSSVMKDLAAALSVYVGFGDEGLTFAPELSIFGDRADFWILRRFGVPVGAIEVKKPDRGILAKEEVAGQLYDYMLRLRAFYGLDHVFGIASTYAEWRVFWLEDCETVATSTEMPPKPEHTDTSASLIRRLVPNVPDWTTSASDANTVLIQSTPSPAKDRVVRASKVYKWDDPDLLGVLLSVLLRMARSPATRLKVLTSIERKYIRVTTDTWLWDSLDKEFGLRLWPMARKDTRNFYLLLHLGDGVSGRAWLAASEGGAACVLKFPRSDAGDLDGTFEREATIWRDVWGVTSARVQIVANKKTLVLPYVQMVQDAHNADVDAAKRAIKKLANEKWCHTDLSWRHIGLITKAKKTEAVLIDFGNVKANVDTAEAEAAMLQALKLG